MRRINRRKKAVAPVLATLLMIAVAVAMSVIIFMWSQGFLSQTSESTGGQQGAQNQAAQSSIAIEIATFTASDTAPDLTIIVRNVGAVSVTLGSITVTGLSANTGLTGSITSIIGSTASTQTSSDGTWKLKSGTDTTITSSDVLLSKGASITLTLYEDGTTTLSKTDVDSGDIITFKVTTDVGTFAQASYTVP